MPNPAVHIAPNARPDGDGESVASTGLILFVVCLFSLSATAQAQDSSSGDSTGQAPSSLNGRWVADGDSNFILNIDNGEVEGSYFCRHQPMGVRGEISADG